MADPRTQSRRRALAAVFAIAVALACLPRDQARAGDAPDPRPEFKPTDLEKKAFELLNADRASHQKKPLVFDNRLAAAARAHSADMVENHYFSHESPTKGLIAQRLMAAKIRTVACGENISMNYSVDASETSFMKSDGHRANILSDIFTHCGTGVVEGANGTIYVTQVFAKNAPDVDVKNAPADSLAKLNKARIDAGKLPFKFSPTLAQIAGQAAAAMAEAGKPVQIDISTVAKSAGIDARRIGIAHLATWVPEDLATAPDLIKPHVGLIGIGVAENTKVEKLGYGMFWVVVIFTNE